MDLSKAFDCLPHSLLISKLHAYGFDHDSCSLVADYLSNRRQRVKLSNCRSSWSYLKKGLPQGSVLGPVLFNIFINDMFYFMDKCALYNYADDNSISAISGSVQEVMTCLENYCRVTIKWYIDNGMEANPSKFQFLIGSSRALPPQTLNVDQNTSIISEESVKVLGVLLDNKLSFGQHVSACCSKAARQLNALARISKHLDQESKRVSDF